MEGSRAVGKTTLLKKLQERNNCIIRDGYSRKDFDFKLENKDDFIINQKLYIACECAEYKVFKKTNRDTFVVKGAYTIEFFTQQTAKLYQHDLLPLENDLEQLKKCIPDGVIFLDCSKEKILERYKNDTNVRETMNIWIDKYYDNFRSYYLSLNNIHVIDTTNLTDEEVYKEVLKIIK